jgi:hypothetical protein
VVARFFGIILWLERLRVSCRGSAGFEIRDRLLVELGEVLEFDEINSPLAGLRF